VLGPAGGGAQQDGDVAVRIALAFDQAPDLRADQTGLQLERRLVIARRAAGG
jgi:hypothetical protein